MTEDDVMSQLTPQEAAELAQYLQPGAPTPEEKHNTHKFLHDVAESDDTTKTGFLKDEELGTPVYPVRTNKELALFCSEVANMEWMADYFNKKSEITTATSLSRDAKLIELAVITRRELADVTKKPKENKGWFKRKKKE